MLKGVTKTIKNEIKEQRGGFLSMLLGTLSASLLGNLLTGKGIERAGSGNNKGKGVVRTGQKTIGFLIKLYPLTNFEVQKYYENESRFNGVFSSDNLPRKIKDGAYVIDLDEYEDIGTHWIAFFCKKMKLFILIVLELNIFLKKLKNLLQIKI